MTQTAEKKIDAHFKHQQIISFNQFDRTSLKKLFSLTPQMADLAKNAKASQILEGNIVSLLFFEPSSRTFNSFAAAIKQLGGQTLEQQNLLQVSSVVKGETFEDTIKVFEAYSDAIVLRHPQPGSAQQAATLAAIPVINAGDGNNEHPTQTILDLYTIYEKFGTLEKLTGVIAGDICNSRTIHSLIRGLSIYPNNTVYLLSTPQLRLSRADFSRFTKKGIKLIEISNEKDIPQNAHFWYWNRIQKERFASVEEYEKVKNIFTVTPQFLKKYGSKDMIILDPLPRIGTITEAVDSDPRALYLKNQIRNGMYTRMALIALVLGRIE